MNQYHNTVLEIPFGHLDLETKLDFDLDLEKEHYVWRPPWIRQESSHSGLDHNCGKVYSSTI